MISSRRAARTAIPACAPGRDSCTRSRNRSRSTGRMRPAKFSVSALMRMRRWTSARSCGRCPQIPLRDLELHERLEGREPDARNVHESGGVRPRVLHRALRRAGVLARGQHVDVDVMLGLPEALAEPLGPDDQPPAEQRGVGPGPAHRESSGCRCPRCGGCTRSGAGPTLRSRRMESPRAPILDAQIPGPDRHRGSARGLAVVARWAYPGPAWPQAQLYGVGVTGEMIEMGLLARLRVLFPESSGRALRQWLADGRVRVDGVVVRDARVEIGPDQAVASAIRTGRVPRAAPAAPRG